MQLCTWNSQPVNSHQTVSIRLLRTICLHLAQSTGNCLIIADNLLKCFFIYFMSAVVGVDCSHMTASSSALWGSFSAPSDFVSGRVSTMWFMV